MVSRLERPGHERQSRVLIVSPQPYYEDRGTPIATRQLIRALCHLGYTVDLATYPVGQDEPIAGLQVFRTANPFRIRSVPIGLSLRKLLLDVALIGTVRKRLRRGDYAFVHAVEEMAFPAVSLGRRYGVPVVYDMQSSLPEQLSKHKVLRGRLMQAWLSRCERWLLRHSDLVMCSAGLIEQVRLMAPQTTVREWHFHSPIQRIEAGEVADLRTSLGIPAAAQVIVYTGTFEKYQGLEQLLAAVPLMRREFPKAVVVLLGATGGRGRELAQAASQFKLNGSVRIVDRQQRSAVPPYLAMADVLVSPRDSGGNLPLKIFDYLSAGRPIVASDNPTHRAVLDDDRAVLVEPTAEALAQATVGLLKDPERAARISHAAQRYAEKHFGWMNFVDSVDELARLVEKRD